MKSWSLPCLFSLALNPLHHYSTTKTWSIPCWLKSDHDSATDQPSFSTSSGERGAQTPVGGATDEDHEFTGGGGVVGGDGGPQFTNPSLLPPDYYPPAYSSSSGDHYDSRRGPGGRRLPASVSSSDNNSDTTYAESADINSSLRARMQALDSGEWATTGQLA